MAEIVIKLIDSAGKWYAVKNENIIYYGNWNNIKNFILGKSGIKFKGFTSENQARLWLREGSCSSYLDPKINVNETRNQRTFNSMIAYTDGSFLGSTKTGGWAYILVQNNKIVTEKYGGLMINSHQTNNRGELEAIIRVVMDTTINPLKIYSDSKYAIKSFTIWSEKWKGNGWLTSTGREVKNQDLIKMYHELCNDRTILLHHVKGHSGDRFNEHVDKLAKLGASSI